MKPNSLKYQKQAMVSKTSNGIIAGDGREWFMIEYKFKKKCYFVFLKVLLNFN